MNTSFVYVLPDIMLDEMENPVDENDYISITPLEEMKKIKQELREQNLPDDIRLPYQFVFGGFYRRIFQERDIRFSQIIPYVIVKTIDNRYLVYKRSGSERRLRELSIGVGGHIEIEDMEEQGKCIEDIKNDFSLAQRFLEDFIIPIEKTLERGYYTLLIRRYYTYQLSKDRFGLMYTLLYLSNLFLKEKFQLDPVDIFTKNTLSYKYFQTFLMIYLSMMRELNEELNIKFLNETNFLRLNYPKFLGVIRLFDKSDLDLKGFDVNIQSVEDISVDNVHQGLLFEWVIPNQMVVQGSNEIPQGNFRFVTFDELKLLEQEGKLESWSSFQVQVLKKKQSFEKKELKV